MTRRSDLMLEDISGCDHTPELPVVENGEIVFWLCRCGREHWPEKKEAEHGAEKKEEAK